MSRKKLPLLAQYACGECGRSIEGIFAKLVYLGREGHDLLLPDPDRGILRPNAMLCRRHIQYFPAGVINDSPLEGLVNYGLMQADAIRCQVWWDGKGIIPLKAAPRRPQGYRLVEVFRIDEIGAFDFLSEAMARYYFSSALRLIDNYFLIGCKGSCPSRLDS